MRSNGTQRCNGIRGKRIQGCSEIHFAVPACRFGVPSRARSSLFEGKRKTTCQWKRRRLLHRYSGVRGSWGSWISRKRLRRSAPQAYQPSTHHDRYSNWWRIGRICESDNFWWWSPSTHSQEIACEKSILEKRATKLNSFDCLALKSCFYSLVNIEHFRKYAEHVPPQSLSTFHLFFKILHCCDFSHCKAPSLSRSVVESPLMRIDMFFSKHEFTIVSKLEIAFENKSGHFNDPCWTLTLRKTCSSFPFVAPSCAMQKSILPISAFCPYGELFRKLHRCSAGYGSIRYQYRHRQTLRQGEHHAR